MASWLREKAYLKFLYQKSDNVMREINRLRGEVEKIQEEKRAVQRQMDLLSQQINFYQRAGQISYQTLLENRRKIAVIIYQVKALLQQIVELDNRELLLVDSIKNSNLVIKMLSKKSYKFELMLKQKRFEQSLMSELSNENEIQELAIYGQSY